MSAIVTEDGKKFFDTRVDILDPKTGRVIKHQPYTRHVHRGGNPEEWFERDGIRYFANGECIDKKKLEAKEAMASKSIEKELI